MKLEAGKNPAFLPHSQNFALQTSPFKLLILICCFCPRAIMNILELYNRESTTSGLPVIIMALISGIANGLMLSIIIEAASVASNEELAIRYFFMFIITLALFIYTKRFALFRATIIAENIINRVRVRISDKVRQSELLFLENIGSEEVYTRITQHTNKISDSALYLINALQSAIVLVFCLMFIAWLSKLAFLITLIAIAVGLAYFVYHEKMVAADLRATTQNEGRFFNMLNQGLKGFKELKMNHRKSEAFFTHFKEYAHKTEELKIKTGLIFAKELMFSQIFFYILLGVIIFFMPRQGFFEEELIVRLTSAILFIIGPLNLTIMGIPVFSQANVAVQNLYSLEKQLDEINQTPSERAFTFVRRFRSFQTIAFEDVTFQYRDATGSVLFGVGPFNLSISRGETLFIVGGNGSGKTTFLKLLSGLYYPAQGQIKLDDMPLNHASYHAYRELFSVIFSDFHLFERLYGLNGIDLEKLHYLLELMELDKKTDVIDNRFSTIDLSTGQRKRLALIVALMEDRDILVFDEWAADQDPIFRKYFYEVILRDLKKLGKTVIAVSHDDRYFNYADRIIKMEYGKINDDKSL